MAQATPVDLIVLAIPASGASEWMETDWNMMESNSL